MLGFTALSDARRALEGIGERRVVGEGREVFRQHLEPVRSLCRRAKAASPVLLRKAQAGSARSIART